MSNLGISRVFLNSLQPQKLSVVKCFRTFLPILNFQGIQGSFWPFEKDLSNLTSGKRGTSMSVPFRKANISRSNLTCQEAKTLDAPHYVII